MRKTLAVFIVLSNGCSLLPSTAIAGSSGYGPAPAGGIFSSQAISDPDIFPFRVASKRLTVLKAQLIQRAEVYAMRRPAEQLRKPNLLATWLPADDQRYLIQIVKLLGRERDFEEAKRALMSFGHRGEDSLTQRNRFRALVSCLSVTLLHPDPKIKKHAEDILTDLIRTQGSWVVEPASAQSPALTAEEYILMQVVTGTALPWSKNNQGLIFLYRDLWPHDLSALDEANVQNDLPDRTRAMQNRCERGRIFVGKLFAIVAEEGHLNTYVRWANAFPQNLSSFEYEFYSSESLHLYRMALQQTMTQAIKNSQQMSDRQSSEVNLLNTLMGRNHIDQQHISLGQLEDIIRLHGQARVLQFASVVRHWTPKHTVAFLNALAKTESTEIHQREIEALALQLEGVLAVVGPMKYPWTALSFEVQVRIGIAQGTDRLAALERAAAEWTPPNLLLFLNQIAELDPADIPNNKSITRLSRGAKDIQKVLVKFDYPWDRLTLSQQIALAKAEQNMRIGLAKRFAPNWEAESNVVSELQQLDAPSVARTSVAPALAVIKERAVALRAGSRVYWLPKVGGATISQVEVAGGENPEIRIYIRIPNPRNSKQATMKWQSLKNLQDAGVPAPQLRSTALAALKAQNITEVPQALAEKYSFLKKPETPTRTSSSENKKAPAAERQKIDPKKKQADALWKRLAHWAAHPVSDWLVVFDPALEGERWKGGTIGFIYKPLPVKGIKGEVASPTVTYAADASGNFNRYVFVPVGVGSFAWPARADDLMADLNQALGIKHNIWSQVFDSKNHLDPNIAIAAGQVVKITRALGNDPTSARQAFHDVHQELEEIFNFSQRAELAATLKKLKLFSTSQIKEMQRPIRGARKGQWPVTHTLWTLLSNGSWSQHGLHRFTDEDEFTAVVEERWVPWTLASLIGTASVFFGASPWDAIAYLPTMMSFYRIALVLMHVVGLKELRPQDRSHWNRIFIIAFAPLIPYLALHGWPAPMVLAGSMVISDLSKRFHHLRNAAESGRIFGAAA